jgi:sugar phosphate isomerase/epimerase
MNKFSLGIFLNIFTNNKVELQSKINFIKSFPCLGHIEIWSETDLSQNTIDWLKKELSNYQIIYHGPFTALSLTSGHDLINQASIGVFKKYIDQAIKMGAKLMTVHAGKYPHYLNYQKATNKFIENFSKLLLHTNNQIILTTENMTYGLGAQIDFPLLKDLNYISNINHDINFTIDIGHCIRSNEDYYSFIKQNQINIKNIHLHNASYQNQKDHFGLQLPGDLDTKKFINFLKEIKYQGFLTIEVLTEEDKIESVKMVNS